MLFRSGDADFPKTMPLHEVVARAPGKFGIFGTTYDFECTGSKPSETPGMLTYSFQWKVPE
ncbi:Uncharacterised protein [Mycobacteroides abscessus subsp. abscessus]|nr:hypothetical protein E3G43_001085 [Mycobacteroides abscessus]SIJ60441.1 Uncharacterised protein [Mycobacteroides abscessus subsp. abscessus]SIL37801.1 Uncharacterised protein [Mycobacteroides abscessus subsp. abscessus]SIM89244.1 Uncharacterised protein [Mycobacteroides abscessus subsp. abscessus]SLI69374.1 Uncharacterised protein [Mycobacteroides abscessus subsp. abscessus]